MGIGHHWACFPGSGCAQKHSEMPHAAEVTWWVKGYWLLPTVGVMGYKKGDEVVPQRGL